MLARLGVVGLVVGLKGFEIIGEVGLPPIKPKLPAVGDQLAFAERLRRLGFSSVSAFFFTSCTP